MRIFVSCLAVILAFPGTDAAAASFDCAQARTLVETAVRGDPVLNRRDKEVNRQRLDPLSPRKSLPRMRTAQAAWLAGHDRCQGDIPCLRRRYSERLVSLRSSTGNVHFDWPGDRRRNGGRLYRYTPHIQPSDAEHYRPRWQARIGERLLHLDGYTPPNGDHALAFSGRDCRLNPPCALLMRAADGRFWIAPTSDSDGGEARYHSNAPGWIDRRPATVRSWFDARIDTASVKLMTHRGEILPHPYR
ncbi:MAG: hypothetical protein LBL59_02875 [Xanthomonadaceae bacterium]|jgi:hypothetical protein|nr:hypothetical protein [Xanthomonadaceae bacterium]